MEVHYVNQVQPDILSWKWRKGEAPRPPGPLPCPMGAPRAPLSPPPLAAHGHLSQHEPCTSPAHHPGNAGHGEVATTGSQCPKGRLGICEPHSHQGPAPQHPQPFQKVPAPDHDLTLTRKWWACLCTVAHQAPLPIGFSRQEYWSGLLFPFPGDLSNSGIKPRSPTLQADSLPYEPRGKL